MTPEIGMSIQLNCKEVLMQLCGIKFKYLCDGLLVGIEYKGLSSQNIPAKGIFEIEKVENDLIFTTCGRVFDKALVSPIHIIKAGTQVLFKSSQVRQSTENVVVLRSDRGVDYQHSKSTLHNLIIDCYTGNGWYKLTSGRKVFHRWLMPVEEARIVESKKYEPATEEDLEKAKKRLIKHVTMGTTEQQIMEACGMVDKSTLSPEKHREFMQRGECLHPQRFQSEIKEKIALAREEYHKALATKKQCGVIYNIFGLPMPETKKSAVIPYENEDPRADWWSENINRAERLRREAYNGIRKG